jgi:hypothetical protein
LPVIWINTAHLRGQGLTLTPERHQMTSAPAGIRGSSSSAPRAAAAGSRSSSSAVAPCSWTSGCYLLLQVTGRSAVVPSAQCPCRQLRSQQSAVRSTRSCSELASKHRPLGRRHLGRCISVPRRAHMVCYHSHWVVIGAHWAFGTWDIMTYGHAPDAPCTVRHVYANAGAIFFNFFKHNHRLHIPPLVIGAGNSRS